MVINGVFTVRWQPQDGVDGKDGADGKDGVDGKNAYIPSIYVEGAAGYVHAYPFVKVTDADGNTVRTNHISQGIGIYTVNPSTLEISHVASYSSSSTSELSDAINGISDDMFVAIVSYGSSRLDATFSQAIKSLGAPDIVQEKESGGSYPFAMIGKKGMKPGTAAVSYIDIITDDDQRRATAMAYIVGDQLVCASTVTGDMVLNLDNDNDTMLYDGAGNVVGSKPKCTCSVSMMGTDVTSRLSRTATDGDYISISPTGCTVSAIASDYSFEVTDMSADNAKVEVTAVYHGVTRTSTMNITRLVGVDKYELVCTPGNFTYNTTTSTASERDLKIQVYRTSQNGVRELLQSLPTGYSIKFVRSGQITENTPDNSYTDGYLTIQGITMTFDYYTILLKDNNNKVLDSETIPILKANDGVNAIRLDLDNENDSILTDGSGNVVGTLPSTTARLYDGANQVSGGIEWSCKATGVTVEESAYSDGTYEVEVVGITADEGLSVTISAKYKGVTYTSIMTLTVLKGVDKYEMVCTPGSVTYNTSTQVSSGRDVKIQVYRTSQNGARELLKTLPKGYSIKYISSAETSENTLDGYDNYYLMFINMDMALNYYTLLLKDANGKTLDSETIPIIKSKDGDAAIRIDLDNEYDSILYSSRGDKLSADVVTNVHVYEGDKEITGSVTSEISVQVLGGSCIESTIKDDAGNKIGKKVTVDSISSDAEQCLVTVTLNHAGTVYTAVFTVKKLVGTDKYDLSVTPTSISYNSTTKDASSSSIKILVYRTDANGVRTELESLTNDGLTLEVKKVVSGTYSTVTASYGTGGAVVSSLDMTASQYTVTLKKGSSVMDTETVPINKSADGAKGEAGANAIRLDLDNENDTMLYDDLGNLVSGNVTSQASLYNGTTKVTSGIEWSAPSTGCTASVSTSGLVTVTAMSASTGKCTVTAKYNNVNYTSVLSLKKVVNGAKYSIILSTDSVQVNSSTGSCSHPTVKASFYRMGMDGVNIQMTGQDLEDYKIVVWDTNMEEEILQTISGNDIVFSTANPVYNESILVRVTLYDRAGTEILDYADIPILYVSNGSDGNGIASHTISFAITTKPVAPAESSSEWVLSTASDCPKEGTKYKPYLWQKDVITYSNDTSLNKTIIRLVSVYNLDTRPQLLRQTAFDNEDVMDKWTIKNVNVVADTASSNAVAHMAAATDAPHFLLGQYIFTVGGESIINAGRYYTFSFYTRTRIPINKTLYGNNLERIKVWLTTGCTYMMEASFRINQTASGNGKTGFVKFRAGSEYSNNDKTIYNSSSYDKRVSLSSSNYFSVSTDGEYTIEFGLYKAGATYDPSESITVNWIRVVPTQAVYNYSISAYLGEQGCVDKTGSNYSDAFKDGVLLSSGGDKYGGATFYPILDTDDKEDDNGWTRHWFAYRTKDSKDNWYLSTSSSITNQRVSIRVLRIPYLEIKQPKLEEGIMPTTWCEHKDDDTMYCSHNPCGTWSGLNTYYYCRGQRDVVKYYTDSNNTDMTWWRMRQRTSKAGYNSPTPPYSDPSHWETSNKLKFTIVDSMFAEEIFTDKLTVGRLNTYNNNGSISIEGGLIKVFGNSNAIPQIVMGADENGNAVLSIYDKTGGKVWDLSVNGLKGIDIIEMKMTEVKYYNVATHVQCATLSNSNLTDIVNKLTSGKSLTSYYQFSCKKQMNNGVVMRYYYGTNATEGTNTPPPNEGKYYASSSTNATTLLPTGARMPTGLYTQKTKNHYSTIPDEGTGVAVLRCALIRVNNGVFAAGNRYIEWKSDKTYIHLVDGANEYTYGSLQ